MAAEPIMMWVAIASVGIVSGALFWWLPRDWRRDEREMEQTRALLDAWERSLAREPVTVDPSEQLPSNENVLT